MKPYVQAYSNYRKLELAKQGIVNAVADIEKLENGREAKRDAENPRLKYEKGALCQADNEQEQWKSPGRFIWGLSADGKKALLVGYVPQHEHGRYAQDYDKLKRKAAKITDRDFLDAREIESSEDIKRRQEEKAAAELATKKKECNWREDLQNAYMSWQEFFSDEPELAKEGFEETVRTYLKEHPEIVDQNSGNLTNRERGKLECSITLDPKFKQEMKEICNKIKGETKSIKENNPQKENEEKKGLHHETLKQETLRNLMKQKCDRR